MGVIQGASTPMTRQKPIKPDPLTAITWRLHNAKEKIIAMLELDLPGSEEVEEAMEAIAMLEQLRAKHHDLPELDELCKALDAFKKRRERRQ